MIDFLANGGICNRLRAIDSIVSLLHGSDQKLRILWARTSGLNAPFKTLFQPLNLPNVDLIDIEFFSPSYIAICPRFPFLNALIYDENFYTTTLNVAKSGSDFKQRIIQSRSVSISCSARFHPGRDNYSAFHPIFELQQIIDKRSAAFGENTIGVHIRRSDHKKSIASSPDAAFEFFMDQEIAANPKTDFFLATDSPDTKHHFVKKYGSRITTFYETASRLRSQGVRNAVVDLYLLSRTRKVFGSHQSSFSQAAGIIGGIENIQVALLAK